MSVQRNHLVEPEIVKAYYSTGEQVDFKLSFLNRDLLCGSIRVMGTLVIGSTADADASDNRTSEMYMDHMIGAHALFEDVLTTTQNDGLTEGILNYPRFVGMLNKASLNVRDTLNASTLTELICPSNEFERNLLIGFNYVNNDRDIIQSPSFSLVPSIMFNRPVAGSNPYLSYSKTGDITLSFRLNTQENMLWGVDPNTTPADYNVFVKDLRLSFVSFPANMSSVPNVFHQVYALQQPISTTFSTISTRAPCEACSSIMMSFIQNSRQSSLEYNNYEQEELPSLTAVEFLFNDVTNQFITYEIRNKPEMISRYLEAVNGALGSSMSSLERSSANQGYGLGVSFNGTLQDLSKTKFTAQISSAVNNNNPYTATMYFNNRVQV